MIKFFSIKLSASEQIKSKWPGKTEMDYFLRSVSNNDLKIPEKPKLKCTNLTYNGSKLYNMLRKNLRENQDPKSFKMLTKKWVWEQIPSY